MNVGQVYQPSAVTVRTFDELTRAAELMRDKHVGYLVVVEPSVGDGLSRPVGVLTDRDIVVTVVARRSDPRTLRVGDVMTQHAVTVTDTDSIDRALQEMRRIGVRRLPVVGRRGELVGVLSLDDVLNVVAGELQNVAGSIRNERQIEGALRP